MAKYHIISCHVLWREICYFAALSPHTVTFNFLEQGLHNTPDLLRLRLQEAIDAVESGYDAILIGYGLCCNGVVGIRARSIPLVIIKGHDCITFFLGSRERYQEYFAHHPGTYWYTPGWIETPKNPPPGREQYEWLLKYYSDKYGEEYVPFLMQTEQRWIKDYSSAAYVDTGLFDAEKYKRYTRECACYLGWNYDEVRGDPRLIKAMLEGHWNSSELLVVQPGEMIVATHDDAIIGARKSDDSEPAE